MAGPWERYATTPQPIIPGSGPKAPAGYGAPGAPAIAPLQGGPDDPNVIARNEQLRANIQLQKEIAAAQQRAQIEAAAKAAEAARERQRVSITPEGRTKAMDAFSAAQRIRSRVAEMRRLYGEGPGATSGLAGIQDYFPTVANSRFNAAGNSVRGDVGRAMGFTGGQLNTAAEAAAAVGPYLPQSSDFDPVALDKMARLEELAGNAEMQAVSQLGGRPNPDGTISPYVMGAQPPAPPAPPGGGVPPTMGGGSPPPMLTPGGQGGFSVEPDPTKRGVAQRVNQLLQGGASDDQIRAYAREVNADPRSIEDALNFRRANPNYRGGYDASNLELRYVPMSAVRQGIDAAAQSGPGTAMINAADALTMGNLDSMTANPALTRAGMRGLAQMNPGSATLGQVAGGVSGALMAEGMLGAAGARMAPGMASRLLQSSRTADALYGAGTGAGNADEGSRLGGAITGAGAALVGGEVANRVGRGVGNIFRGARDVSVDALQQTGVPLTVGQAAGGTLKGIEDRLTGVPFVGDIVNARRSEGLDKFNQAAFDQAVQPLGAGYTGPIAEPGVDVLRQTRNAAYRKALDNVTLQVDPAVQQGLAAAEQRIAALPKDMRDRGTYALARLREGIDQNNQISGRAFQNMIRRLRKTASENARQPNGQDLAEALGGAEQTLTGMLAQQAPDAFTGFNAANKANRNIEVLRGAVNRARNGTRSGETGVFTPSQLADEAAGNARRFGNSQGTTNQPFFNLTRAGQQVLPSSIPDSGTAGRLAVLGLPAALGGAGGGVGGLTSANPVEGAQAGAVGGLGLAGLLAAGGSKPAQRALVAALTRRPDRFVQIGDKIYNAADLLGPAVGAGTGLALTTQR